MWATVEKRVTHQLEGYGASVVGRQAAGALVNAQLLVVVQLALLPAARLPHCGIKFDQPLVLGAPAYTAQMM